MPQNFDLQLLQFKVLLRKVWIKWNFELIMFKLAVQFSCRDLEQSLN